MWEERLWATSAWLWWASYPQERFKSGSRVAEATRGERGSQQPVTSPGAGCGSAPALQAEPECGAFPIGCCPSSGAGTRGRAPLGIGPSTDSGSVCAGRRFARSSGCAQGRPLRVPAVIGSVRFPWGRGAAGGRASFRLCWEPRGTAEDEAGLCRGTSGPRDPVSGTAAELRGGEGRERRRGPSSLPPGWRAQ